MPRSVLVAASSVRDFFQEAVNNALKHQAIQPDEATESYLVDLLCDQTRIEKGQIEQALAFVLAQTYCSLPSQSVAQLKEVGDQSLYVAGYFSDSLRRSQLDPSYYIILGGTAYRRLSAMLHRMGNSTRLVVVYAELGQDFIHFVQVLNYIKHQTSPSETHADMSDEEWLKANEDAEEKLKIAQMMVVSRRPLKQ